MDAIEKKSNKLMYKRIKMYNIVVTPTESQKPERYVEIFKNIHSEKIEVKTFGDRFTAIKTIYGVGTDLIHGEFVNFLRINSKMPSYNTEESSLVSVTYDPKYGPNAKVATYYFIPSIHKLVLHETMAFSDSQVIKFLENAILQVLKVGEGININVEKSENIIEEIINSEEVHSLFIELSYTNNANLSVFEKKIDDSYRESGIKLARSQYLTEKKGLIKIIKDGIIETQLRLSQSNGYAKAFVVKNKKTVEINTQHHPRVEIIKFIEDLPKAIYDAVVGYFPN